MPPSGCRDRHKARAGVLLAETARGSAGLSHAKDTTTSKGTQFWAIWASNLCMGRCKI